MVGSTNALQPSGLNPNVERQVAEVARALCASGDHIRCTQLLATLGRPRFDEMSDSPPRHTARAPVWEPERKDWDEV